MTGRTEESWAYTIGCALSMIGAVIIFFVGLDVIASFMPGQHP